MAEKKFDVRHTQKTDTADNWSNATFIPKKGELIIYQEESATTSKIKIGNGTSKVGELDFSGGEGGGADLSEIEDDIAGIKETIGDFETALDAIIEIQNSLIGGEE